jgi:hypothetical protein
MLPMTIPAMAPAESPPEFEFDSPVELEELSPPLEELLLEGLVGAEMPDAIWHWVPVHSIGQTQLFESTCPPL